MEGEGNLEYALTRVYARHGQRLDEAAWRRVEASRDLNHYMAAMRATALAPWVASMNAQQDCRALESSLRSQWRRHVDGVARWHPREWQAWLAWLAYPPFLNLIAQLARPEAVPSWILADPVVGPFAPGTPANRSAAMADTPLAPLAAAVAGQTTPRAAWSTHWQALLPHADGDTRRSLDLLRRAIEQHDQGLLQAVDTAEPQRQKFALRLRLLMRIAAGTAIVTVCHLGLLALDLERLRSGLVRRCLFVRAEAEHA